MSDLQPVLDQLDAIATAQVAQEATLSGIASAVSALVTTIQSLEAQVAAGGNVSPEDLQALKAKAQVVADETTKLGAAEDAIAASDKAPA